MGGGKCGLKWDSHISNSELNAKWDCKGSADEVVLKDNNIYVNVNSKKCVLEFAK